MANIGDLRKRIQVQSPVYSKDTNGGIATDWMLARIVWGSIIPKDGMEPAQAAQGQAVVKHDVTLRMQPDLKITTNNRLVFLDRVFNIVSILNEYERNFLLNIVCDETVGKPKQHGLFDASGNLIVTDAGQTIFV